MRSRQVQGSTGAEAFRYRMQWGVHEADARIGETRDNSGQVVAAAVAHHQQPQSAKVCLKTEPMAYSRMLLRLKV